MERYGRRYTPCGSGMCCELYLTRWGKIARWLRLPDRHAAKFVEAPHQ